MSKRLLLGLALLVAAGFSGWSAWQRRASAPAPIPVEQNRSDYVMRDFELISLDVQGKESLTLRAPEMQRDLIDQTLAIVQPVFLVPNTHGQHWEVAADTGWVSADGNELRLKENVVGTSPATASRATTFKTDHLNVFPRENRANTDAAVSIRQPGLILTGTGMDADLASNHVQLQSNVQAIYDPASL